MFTGSHSMLDICYVKFDDAKSWKKIGNVGLTVVHMFSGNAWHLLKGKEKFERGLGMSD